MYLFSFKLGSIIPVTILTFGKSVVSRSIPSGQAITFTNTIFSSLTPFAKSDFIAEYNYYFCNILWFRDLVQLMTPPLKIDLPIAALPPVANIGSHNRILFDEIFGGYFS